MNFLGLLRGTTISVDNFTLPGATLWFLTHFHADHYVGLDSSFNGVIYCSEITRGFLLHKFSLPPHKIVGTTFSKTKVQIGLDIDEAHTIECPQTFARYHVQLFPANHCPGSVMFLFEGDFGRYLHTGDFRYHEAMKDFSFIVNRTPLDILYLDTTFANPFWEVIPTKEEAIRDLCRLIDDNTPKTEVFIECDMLGTEQIILSIHERYHSLVHVEEEKFLKLIEGLPEIEEILTKDSNSTRFHVCRAGTLGNLSPKKELLKNMKQYVANPAPKSRRKYNQEDGPETVLHQLKEARTSSNPVLYIKPSTQWFGVDQGSKLLPKPRQDIYEIWHILYSIHSSYSEIRSFVSLISEVHSIVPLVPIEREAINKINQFVSKKELNGTPPFPSKPVTPKHQSINQNEPFSGWKKLQLSNKKSPRPKTKLEPLKLSQDTIDVLEQFKSNKEPSDQPVVQPSESPKKIITTENPPFELLVLDESLEDLLSDRPIENAEKPDSPQKRAAPFEETSPAAKRPKLNPVHEESEDSLEETNGMSLLSKLLPTRCERRFEDLFDLSSSQ